MNYDLSVLNATIRDIHVFYPIDSTEDGAFSVVVMQDNIDRILASYPHGQHQPISNWQDGSTLCCT